MGIIGSFEGWVPEANDLYLRGNNPAGFAGASTNAGRVLFLSDRIEAKYENTQNNQGFQIVASNYYDFAKFNTLSINLTKISGVVTSEHYFELYNGANMIIRNNIPMTNNQNLTVSFNISNVAYAFQPKIGIRDVKNTFYMPGIQIFRIWLST